MGHLGGKKEDIKWAAKGGNGIIYEDKVRGGQLPQAS
jgi:hypothetical protein